MHFYPRVFWRSRRRQGCYQVHLRKDFVLRLLISISAPSQPVECLDLTLTDSTLTFPFITTPLPLPGPRALPGRAVTKPLSLRYTLPIPSARPLPSLHGFFYRRVDLFRTHLAEPRTAPLKEVIRKNPRRTYKAMAHPVFRTASPYTDPNIKGPRSQILSSGTAFNNARTSWSTLSTFPFLPLFLSLFPSFSLSLLLFSYSFRAIY